MSITILHSTGTGRAALGTSLTRGDLAGAPVGFDTLAPRAQETYR